MKCKGMVSEKTKNGRTIKRKCNHVLADETIFCDKCGFPTNALKSGLNAKQNLNQVRQEFQEVRSNYYSFNLFFLLAIFLPLGLAIFFRESMADFLGLNKYLFINISMLILVPFTMIPFAFEPNFTKQVFKIKNYFQALKHYPKFFLFTLISLLFFLLLKILCTGYLIGVTVDPILHPVRFILVLYWIAIMLPVPLVMMRKEVNAFKAVKMCYVASAETRWQQFFTAFYVVSVNVLGALVLGLGLLRSISFSYLLIERYYQKLDEYKLF